ncbi:MAG: hypothetical protein K0R55_1832 [Sporomusa sp.]|nr:hypothetical protein [Sporomusa sp.]
MRAKFLQKASGGEFFTIAMLGIGIGIIAVITFCLLYWYVRKFPACFF